jgi:hypothetical protein
VEDSRLAAEALHSHQERRLVQLGVWKQAGIEQVSESVCSSSRQTRGQTARGSLWGGGGGGGGSGDTYTHSF